MGLQSPGRRPQSYGDAIYCSSHQQQDALTSRESFNGGAPNSARPLLTHRRPRSRGSPPSRAFDASPPAAVFDVYEAFDDIEASIGAGRYGSDFGLPIGGPGSMHKTQADW